MAVTKTIQFLPEIFRTDTNQKFLNATMDQLVTDPDFRKVNGYIGREFSPSYKSTDNYIKEPTATRQNYQLEPHVIVKDSAANKINFYSGYPDVVNKINYYGGNTTDHNRMFNNEYYTFDGHFDFDKFVNFNNYYWLPNGPDAVPIRAGGVPLTYTYNVSFDSASRSWRFSSNGNENNPNLILAQGGTYQFVINEPGNHFYIQSKPSQNGYDPLRLNIDVTQVLGVENNGIDVGTITFTVPHSEDQARWTSMPQAGTADLATTISYKDLQGRSVADINNIFKGIDGFTGSLDLKTLIFVSTDQVGGDDYWTSNAEFDTDIFDTAFDPSGVVPVDLRTSIFRINVYQDTYGEDHILLTPVSSVFPNNKVYVRAGAVYATYSFYVVVTNLYQQIPLITAPLTSLYYQSRQYQSAGTITVSNQQDSFIDPSTDIVGKVYYTSPNGVTLTNGLKITFDANTTATAYAGNTYYVEGVGTAIRLINVANTITPELADTNTYIGFDMGGSTSQYDWAITPPDVRASILPGNLADSTKWHWENGIPLNPNNPAELATINSYISSFDAAHTTGRGFDFDNFDSTITGALTADYITINRASQDLNAWSRSNRWVHIDVITATATYLNQVPIIDQSARAQRPIIEFEADLQLFNYGKLAKDPVNILDTVITDAFSQVEGLSTPTLASADITVGNTTITLKNNTRIVFSADTNPNVKNKIYRFKIANTVASVTNPVYICYLTEEPDALVEAGHTTIILGGDKIGQQYYYNGASWIKAQQKSKINQPPLLDILDADNNSFGDTSVYTNSSFVGTQLFSYLKGTGRNDSVLGFPLSYRNINNIGDIQFQNNYDSDKFTYLLGAVATTKNINTGLLIKNNGLTVGSKVNLWATVESLSKQYQLRKFTYDGTNNYFELEVLPNPSTLEPNLKVVVNNTNLALGQYAIIQIVDRYAVVVNPLLMQTGDTIYVQIFSDAISANSYYEVPKNLDLNSLNTNFQLLTLGQLRNHLIAVSQNNTAVTGQVPGNNNLRDLNYKSTPGNILQHSAPQIYSNLFLVNENLSFINGLRLAQKEYTKFKNRFLENALKLEIDYNDPASATDKILLTINAIKNNTFPWYYSDMVPYGQNNTSSLSYTVLTPTIRNYELTSIFDDTVLSSKAVLVYLTRVIDKKSTKTLLVKDHDYQFNKNTPSITILDSFNLLYGDVISIVEYSSTDGNYIPETPTKLGLYPKFVPQIYLDNTYVTPTQVIQGHDGSLTPAFGDFRDQLLLELELRIYNNLKISYYENNFNLYDYIPGKFRLTEYNLTEFNQIVTQNFLEWSGAGRIDYTTNGDFLNGNGFTWNYRKYNDIINGQSMAGSWRAVFKYFYDTDRPHTHPWEMLGFSEKPDWWETRYGPAPYTAGNSILWSDLSIGYIYSGSRTGFDAKFQRPGLVNFVPVDDQGNLRDPSVFLTKITSLTNAAISWAVGDIGPAENAWRRSSDYPFAVQYALALLKPARYFGTLANINNYKYSAEINQFIDSITNRHIQPTDIDVNGYNNANGSVSRTAGYVNWVSDYLTNLGIGNSAKYIKNALQGLSVQLAYHVGGYTGQNYITVLAEQSSPSSINDSIVVPKENYAIELSKSSPINKVTYSGVIVEKTSNGYSVSGYNLNDPYFTIIPSSVDNSYSSIKIGNETAILYKNYRPVKVRYSYGYEFKTIQQVADFLISYQRYLKSQGFIFNQINSDLTDTQDFTLSVKELLSWAQQGWQQGNVLVLSPVYTTLKLVTALSVVNEITNNPYAGRIIDVNFAPIKSNNFTVNRDANTFTFTSIGGQTIAFAELDLVQFEQTIIFDNQTVFNDIIYSPETGNRQYRLKLIGNKTGAWDGSPNIPGFVYNDNIIADWHANTDYLKGALVTYKSNYYTAVTDIPAAVTFNNTNWQLISKIDIQTGLLNNFSINAGKFTKYYDIDNPIEDSTILAYSQGITGFRERDYLTNIGMDTPTQNKFYQGFIKQKGTLNAVDALNGAQFGAIGSNIAYNEEWAIRVGEYGGLDSNAYIEVILPEGNIQTSPTPILFVDTGTTKSDSIQSYNGNDVYRISGTYNVNVVAARTSDTITVQDLPKAGYVNLNDIDATIFDLRNYAVLDAVMSSLRDGYKIWTAKSFNGGWDVYRCSGLNNSILQLSYNNDNLVKVLTANPHGLQPGDIVAIKNFDSRFDGFYQVFSSDGENGFFILMYQNLSVIQSAKNIYGTGVVFKLFSMRISIPSQVTQLTPLNGWINNDKIWVDGVNGWEVYNKTKPWAYQQLVTLNSSEYTTFDKFGTSVKFNSDATTLLVGAPGNGTGRVTINQRSSADNTWIEGSSLIPQSNAVASFGQRVEIGGLDVAISAPSSNNGTGYVYVYKKQSSGIGLSQILTAPNVALSNAGFGTGMSISGDGRWLYVSSPGVGQVYAYAKINQTPVNQSFNLYGTETSANLLTQGINNTLTSAGGSSGNFTIYSGITSLVPGMDYTFGTNSINFIGITAQNHQTNTASGSTSTFTTTFTISSINRIRVNGIVKTQGNISAGQGDYTVVNNANGTGTVTFLTSPATGANVYIENGTSYIFYQNDYYSLQSQVLTADHFTNFGTSIKTSTDGTQLIIGAPNYTVSDATQAGAIFVYDRSVEKFTGTGSNDIFITKDPLTTIHHVELNGITQIERHDYAVRSGAVQFDIPPTPGSSITIDTNKFRLLNYLTSVSPNAQDNFGQIVDLCPVNCTVYATVPKYKNTINEGAVFRFTNTGRVYGTITGTIYNPRVNPGDWIRINGVVISFDSSSLDSVILKINNSNILGVVASNANGYLQINSTLQSNYKKLDLAPGDGTAFTDLGLQVFGYTQTITQTVPGEKFATGFAVADTADTILISSSGATTIQDNTFDGTKTIFDSGATVFTHPVTGSGAVYTYDLMSTPSATVTNPSLFAFSQQLESINLAQNINYGASMDVRSNYMAVGSDKDSFVVNQGGTVEILHNATGVKGWSLIRSQDTSVDINSLSSAYIYNSVTQKMITHLDHVDPAKGKILGAAEQFIDIKSQFDPAIYNSTLRTDVVNKIELSWNAHHVGRTWWDLSTIRYIDYEQDTITYRSKNWGKLFPGSVVTVYEWVSSNYLPSQYTANGGDGIPKYPDDTAYSSVVQVNQSSGIVTSTYYFWVSKKISVDTTLSTGRNISIIQLENMIRSPESQGIPYLALLSTNAINLYNIYDQLVSNQVVLHVDTSKLTNTNIIHSEYQLVAEHDANVVFPSRIITKLRDSLSGQNSAGLLVPDPTLKPADRYGVLIRPRQGLFINRQIAVENFIDKVNAVMLANPIALQYNITTLKTSQPVPPGSYDFSVDMYSELAYVNTSTLDDGARALVNSDANNSGLWVIYQYVKSTNVWIVNRIQSYNTSLYWKFADWYMSDFDLSNSITDQVNIYADINLLTLSAGNTIKVANNGNGTWAIYRVMTDLSLELVGVQNGTIQLLPSVYDLSNNNMGFDNDNFGVIRFDQNPFIELGYIFDAVYNDIFIDDLKIEFNKLFFTLVNYVFTEQVAPDWIFKTSFATVTQNLRTLAQLPSFINDNQTYYQDYINEVKPFRTQIREYLPTYSSVDTALGRMTDFDLPTYFDPQSNTYRPLNIYNNIDASIISSADEYQDWLNNYTYSVISIELENPGEGYLIPPVVSITGGGGKGATAIATINIDTGQVSGITVTYPGTGYTSIPTVKITGTGEGASGTAILNNQYYSIAPQNSYNTVRNLSTTLKFDRISFASNVQQWQANTAYATSSFVSYSGTAYLAVNANIATDAVFNPARYTVLRGDVFAQATDRITAYYQPIAGMPGKDYAQLMLGIEYPGVKITGAKFNANTLQFTSNVIGFNYQGMCITSNDTTQIDFVKLGFTPDNIITVEGLITNFQNNAQYTIVNVTSNSMMITGAPVSTIAYGANVRITYIDQTDNTNIDTIIQSSYLDTALGTRPEDINIVGGAYVDQYSSHAPEELIPGRLYDTLDLKVITLNAHDETYGWAYRSFYNMNGKREYFRISNQFSAQLAANLNVTDSNISVTSTQGLSIPNVNEAIPGVVFINGEKITYYGIDQVNKKLTQIRRGVDGTGVPLRHLANATVYNSSSDQMIPWSYANKYIYYTGNGTTTTFAANVDPYSLTMVVNGNVVQNWSFAPDTSISNQWNIVFTAPPANSANITIINNFEYSYLNMTGNTVSQYGYGGFVAANTIPATFMKDFTINSIGSSTFAYTDGVVNT
jgi:hypothetical protein